MEALLFRRRRELQEAFEAEDFGGCVKSDALMTAERLYIEAFEAFRDENPEAADVLDEDEGKKDAP